jgi:hypothetical protein
LSKSIIYIKYIQRIDVDGNSVEEQGGAALLQFQIGGKALQVERQLSAKCLGNPGLNERSKSIFHNKRSKLIYIRFVIIYYPLILPLTKK